MCMLWIPSYSLTWLKHNRQKIKKYTIIHNPFPSTVQVSVQNKAKKLARKLEKT